VAEPDLVIVARFNAKPEKAEALEAALLALVEPSRADAGCLQYDLHRSRTEPGVFLFYERWESRDLWQAHMKAPHLTAFEKASEGLVEDAEILEMEAVE
jgi:quinol monooxygenase YgiN